MLARNACYSSRLAALSAGVLIALVGCQSKKEPEAPAAPILEGQVDIVA